MNKKLSVLVMTGAAGLSLAFAGGKTIEQPAPTFTESAFALSETVAYADDVNGVDGAGGNSAGTGDGAAGASEESRQNLNSKIDEAVNSNKYKVDGGGTLTGHQLVKDGNVVSSNYDRLTMGARQDLINDMVQVAENEVAKTNQSVEQNGGDASTLGAGAITEETTSNWIQDIQDNPGVGSKMLAQTLKDVKPDYNKASYIMQPFKGPINTAIAFVVIAVMAFLTLTFALDLSYLYIPFFNALAGGGGSNGGGGNYAMAGGGGASAGSNGSGALKPSAWVSTEAKQAYQEAEQSGKSSAMIYFKKRAVGAIMLGFCIMFLAQGQIFTIVGWILDLVSGILRLN